LRLSFNATQLLPITLDAINDDGVRYVLSEGGTRSSKTYSILQALITIAYSRPVEIDVCRRHLKTVKTTSMEDLEEILKDYDLYSVERHEKSEHIYRLGDSRIRFMGADQGQKLRGAKRDILYINEANELDEDSFRELRRRTRDTIILDLNPSHAASHWIDTQVLGSGRTRRIKSTYKHNPFLSEAQVQDIESDVPVYREEGGRLVKDWDLTYSGSGQLVKGDPVQWAVHGLGQRATSPHLIYQKRQEGPWPGGVDCYGLDFGYSNPMALVRVAFDQDVVGEDTHACVDELVYAEQLTTADLIERMQSLGVRKDVPLYCDAAEPDRIEELQRAGYKAIKAKKSVTAGIDKVNEHVLRFTPRSVNLQAEASRYRRKPGSEDPVKADDHGMDALRYAIFTHLTSDNGDIGAVGDILSALG
jgi:phage terminase large subunit